MHLVVVPYTWVHFLVVQSEECAFVDQLRETESHIAVAGGLEVVGCLCVTRVLDLAFV